MARFLICRRLDERWIFPTITGDSRTHGRSHGQRCPSSLARIGTRVRAAFGVALHMHQPTVLGDGDRMTAPLISNLQHMFEHPGEGDNHNAPAFLRCYGRVADLVGALVERGLPAPADARLLGQPALGAGTDGPDGRARGAPAHHRARARAVDRVARHHVVARRGPVHAGPRSQASHAGLAPPLRRAVRTCPRWHAFVASRRPRCTCPFTPTSASPMCARCASAGTGG